MSEKKRTDGNGKPAADSKKTGRKSGNAPAENTLAEGRGINAATAVICLLSVLLCMIPALIYGTGFASSTDPIEYPLAGDPSGYSPYVQQLDAFEKGQTWIDVRVSEALASLENPYDRAARDKAGVWYMWDRALYNGKYYSYFGIAPILTVYYPYKLLTGKLPGDGTVMQVLLLIASVFMPLCVWQWAASFAPRVPRWLLLFAAPAFFWATLIPLIARGWTPFYYIASVSGCAFLSVFLFLCLSAYGCASRAGRYILLAFAGVAYGLVFQSRLNIAVCAAFVILPGLWFLIIRRERPGADRRKASFQAFFELMALGLPVVLFFTGSFIFNAMRFSGPFDFGSAYQLTVADTSTYKLRLSDIPFAFFHYLAAPAAKSETWPYISFNYTYFTSYGHYVYRDAALGLFNVPLMFSLLASPAVIFTHRFSGSRRALTAGAVAGIAAVALLDFSLGGIIYRYTCDLTVIGAFFSVVVLLSASEKAEASGKAGLKIPVYVLTALFLVFSIWASVRLCLINGNGNVVGYEAEVAEKAAKLFPIPVSGGPAE